MSAIVTSHHQLAQQADINKKPGPERNKRERTVAWSAVWSLLLERSSLVQKQDPGMGVPIPHSHAQHLPSLVPWSASKKVRHWLILSSTTTWEAHICPESTAMSFMSINQGQRNFSSAEGRRMQVVYKHLPSSQKPSFYLVPRKQR